MRLNKQNSTKPKKAWLSIISFCSLFLFLVSCGSPSSEPPGGSPIGVQQVPKARLTYVAIGASDTFGIGADDPQTENWPADLKAQLGSQVRLVNLGIPGIEVHNALTSELPVALDAHPDLVTIWLAVNDLADNVAVSKYSTDLDTLLARLQAVVPHAKIMVGNVPDVSLLPYFHNQNLQKLTAQIQAYNTAIATVTQRHHVIEVDLYQQWKELHSHPEYISGDGLHPSTLGYSVLAALFYQTLQTADAHVLGLR